MDAVELVKVMQRIAKSQAKETFSVPVYFIPEILVKSISIWDKEHPVNKTRQSKFLELYPNTKLDTKGSIDICPGLLVTKYRVQGKKFLVSIMEIQCLVQSVEKNFGKVRLGNEH